jgi:hypothetical protein
MGSEHSAIVPVAFIFDTFCGLNRDDEKYILMRFEPNACISDGLLVKQLSAVGSR